MLSFLALEQLPSKILLAEKTAYCIYVDNKKECEPLAKNLSDATTTYKPKSYTMKEVTTTNVPPAGAGEIVLFVQPNEISSAQLLALIGTDMRKIYPNGNQITVQVKETDEFKEIPLSLTYKGGPITYKPTSSKPSLSPNDIKKIQITIKLTAEMEYNIYDTYDCAVPSNLNIVASQGSLKYSLKSESLDPTRLVIEGDSVKWGKTTFAPGESTLTLPGNTIISCQGTKAPTTPVKIGGSCFFDDSFADKTDKFAEITAATYVFETGDPAYITKGSGGSFVQYKAYCIYQATPLEGGCPNSGFKKMEHKLTTEAVAENNIVAFNGEISLTKDQHDILKRVLLTNDAKSITIECDTTKVPEASLDVRKGIWKLTKAAAVPPSPGGATTLAGLEVTFTGGINPLTVNNNPGELTFKPGGLAITPEDDKVTIDITKIDTTSGIKIFPYVDGDAKIEVKAGSIVVNGATITIPKNKEVEVKPVSGQNVQMSQNGANKELTIKIQSTGAAVSFDSSWNSVKDPIVKIEGAASINTQFTGIPPWLDAASVASAGTIAQNPITPGSTPSKGLEGWAIALIVIACVIVVGAIVVVALNMTGVIHLCGKKKVEV